MIRGWSVRGIENFACALPGATDPCVDVLIDTSWQDQGDVYLLQQDYREAHAARAKAERTARR